MSPHAEGPPTVCVDATELDADGEVVDGLARLALAARRRGQRLVLQGASRELAGLIELAGLTEVLGVERLRPDSTAPKC